MLAQLYESGINVPVDQQQAARFYEIAANSPIFSISARERLGELNEFGIGVREDYAKAMALYQPVLTPDGAPSPFGLTRRTQFAIGRMYAEGKGVAQDYVRAAEWFRRANSRSTGSGGGMPEAECALAIMYWAGLGVEQDQVTANYFLDRNKMKTCKALAAELSSR